MLLTFFNVIYVLVAIAMIALILLQRGAGAAAGSGFGGGASATVFGSRGAANFLSRSTAILAGIFFIISLLMGIYLHPVATKTDNDLGVMSGYQTPEAPKPATPTAGSDVPAATAAPTTRDSADKPASPAAAPADKPAAAPATNASDKPVPTPAPAKKPADKNRAVANPARKKIRIHASAQVAELVDALP